MEALQQIHSCRCIHCDIKPDNILISDSGAVSVIDFSCSHRAGDFGCRAGTFGYRAPEVAARCAGRVRVNGKNGLSPAFRWGPEQDVFSAGMTLLSFVAGKSFSCGLNSDDEHEGIVKISSHPLAVLASSDNYAELQSVHGEVAMHRIAEFLSSLLKTRPEERIMLKSAATLCVSMIHNE